MKTVLWMVWGLAFLPALGGGVEDENPLPRYLTDEERVLVSKQPLRARAVTPPPSGPLRTPAEYEPMDGILLAYEGSTAWMIILEQMAALITTVGEADVYVMADSVSEANQLLSAMTNAGADPSRVHTLVAATDTIWIRDYGPRYVYEGDVRVIVDHTYNRPRPNDNNQPTVFAAHKNHRRYEIPLVHGGGNYHLHGTGIAHTTRLINNENTGLSEAEIHDLWLTYQNLDTNFYNPFPTNIDATQHIDMWMQAIGPNEVMISDWPMDVGSTQDVICDETATFLTQQGYTVHRIPARSVGGTHYTYTNVVMCNDLILLPSYTNNQVMPHNAEALAAWQAAMPEKQVEQVNCQAIVTAAGVMHCIVMHVPAPLGGEVPTVYLQTRPDEAVLAVGQPFQIDWISDDDAGVTETTIELSVDSGQTWPWLVAQQMPGSGSFAWTVPDLFSDRARLRVVVRDGDENTGMDLHALDFSIRGNRPCPPDVAPDNGDGSYGDGVVDSADMGAFLANWRGDSILYDIAPAMGDGIVNIADLVLLVDGLGNCE